MEVGLPTDPGQVTALGQLVGDGDRVGGLPAAEEVEHGIEDQLVRRAVEVVRLDRLEVLGDRVLVEQHRAEHRLLGVEVLRRDPVVRRATGGPPERRVQLRDGHLLNPSRPASAGLVDHWCTGPSGLGPRRPEPTDNPSRATVGRPLTQLQGPSADKGRTAVRNLGTRCAKRPSLVCTLGGQPCGPLVYLAFTKPVTCNKIVHGLWRRESSGVLAST